MAQSTLKGRSGAYLRARRLQCERLLELADGAVLRSICRALTGNSIVPGASSVEALRERLIRTTRRADLCEAALNYLVVPPSKELIPHSEWTLDELVGEDSRVLFHKDFRRAQSVLRTQLAPPRRVCVVLPCTRLKPYNLSATIVAVQGMLERTGIRNLVDVFVFSIPGFVPLEYARHYPFAYYDWDRRRERREDLEMLVRHLYKHALRFFLERLPRCTTYVAYFRPSAPHLLVMQRAAEAVGVAYMQEPSRALVKRIVRKSGSASWRFRGLKRPDCLRALELALRARTMGES